MSQSQHTSDATVQSVRPNVTFESLTFSDGTKVELEKNDIVVFVGPNNAGKSAALKEIEEYVGKSANRRVITKADICKTGSASELRDFIQSKSIEKRGRSVNYSGYRFNVADQHIEHFWQTDLTQLRSFFCLRLKTETRITDSDPAPSFKVLSQPPSHPIHILYKDTATEKRISSYFRKAFGKDLVVFKAGGSEIPLLVGNNVALKKGEDRTTSSYAERLVAATYELQLQGDGMRSFASVVLQTLAYDLPSVLLLDEPEAFLHPPQAKLLGEFLGRERPSHSQMFVATHSPDVLFGLLSAAPDNLRVIRLERNGDVNKAVELQKSQAKAIANDPVMRYSHVMSGIFHERVVICESDGDCLFYQAILGQLSGDERSAPDVLFLHAGGKHRMAMLAESLRALGVSVDVIADVDILNERQAFERLVGTLGGEWSKIEPLWKPLKSAIEKRKPWLDAAGVKAGIEAALARVVNATEFPEHVRSEIENVLKKSSPWSAIKEAGDQAIPAGQAAQQMQSLRKLCEKVGLWIVPVGEIEGFCKSIGGHGPKWVQAVMENKDLKTAPELEGARNFITQVWERRRSQG